jgi:hypothetical protein
MAKVIVAIGILLAISIFVWLKMRSASRRRAIRRYADEHNFRYLGSDLPASLKLDGSSLRQAESVSNAFSGTGKEKDFVFFDCYIPAGKTGYRQSVLAIYLLGESYPACRFDRELREERVGDWRLVYHTQRAWSVSEIDAHVSSL